MAKGRRSPRDTRSESTLSIEHSTTGNTSNTTNNTDNTDKGAVTIMADGGAVLTQDQIDELLSKSRPRGEGALLVEQFISSGAGGWKIDTTTGPFKGKSDAQVFASLNNARKKINPETKSFAIEGADKVRVMKNDSGVYLLNVGSSAPEGASDN